MAITKLPDLSNGINNLPSSDRTVFITMKATDTFHHPAYRHNCAQAIAHKWHQHFEIPFAIVADMKSCGGGRSPEGLCGALYAGMNILDKKEDKQHLLTQFEATTGQTKCLELKRDRKFSCPQCVDLVDRLIEEIEK